jgi:anion-transporting  ArsA/GET3 family ATPase
MSAPRTGLGEVLETSRVVVSVGPGGVGKTSTSAALALEAARRGKRVAVLTIDPARRLANALGLAEIGSEERRIDTAAFTAAGLDAPRGVMTAMMLDVHQMWDDTVRRHHPDPERRERLLQNRMYQTLSSSLAGSQEYMAMEKLHELASRTTDKLDLIVLDTPPSAHAMDFLEAPSRLLDALDNEATRWLIEPFMSRSKKSSRFFDAGGAMVIRTIGRFTGVETLEALAELLSGLQDMFDGFRARARAVRALLGDAQTSFLIVSAPRPGPIGDARAFHTRLTEERVRVGGFVLNRATVDPFEGGGEPAPQALRDAVGRAGGSPELAARIEALVAEQQDAVAVERRLAEALRHVGAPVWMVPELPRDVHDLTGLDRLRAHLVEA